MRWNLVRKEYREDGIWGEMTSEDGQHFLFTLEHAYKITDEAYMGSIEYYPKIQEGVHRLVPYDSPKHGMIVPLFDNLDDPNDQDRKFEIHIGNYNRDSNGCILVGMGYGRQLNGERMLTSSKQGFAELMRVGIDEINIVGT